MTKEQQALLFLVRLGIGNDTESGFDFTGVVKDLKNRRKYVSECESVPRDKFML